MDWVVTDPNGKEFVVTGPEGGTQEQALAYAKAKFGGESPAPMTEAPPPPQLAEEPSTFRKLAEDFVGPENMGAVTGAMTGFQLGSKFGPAGAFLGTVGGAGAGALLGRGYSLGLESLYGKVRSAGEVVSELGEASQRGMVGQATGEGLGKAIPAVGKTIARRLPGSVAARVELGIDALKATINKLMPVGSSTELRAVALKNADTPIPMRAVYDDLQRIIVDAHSGAVPDNQLASIAERLATKINRSGNKLPLLEVQRDLSDIGELVGSLRSQKQNVNPLYARVFASIAKALEKVPAGAQLREVSKLYRKEQAVGELLDEVHKVVLAKRGTGTMDINANRFVKSLENKPFLTESFEAGELDEVMSLAQKLIEMPPIPAPRGAAVGSGRILGPPVMGYGIERMTGLPPGSISGPLAILGAGDELLRILLPTPRGRAVLKRVLESGPLTQTKINVLAATARGISGRNIPAPQLQTESAEQKP